MDTKDFFEALENLKKGLEQVDAASKQVEMAVGSSLDLQKSIIGYANSLKGYQDCLTSFAQSVNDKANDLDGAVLKFKASVESATNLFKEQTEDSLKLFQSQNLRLQEQIEKLASLDSSLDKVANQVSEVNNSINDLAQNISKANEDTNNSLRGIMSDVEKISSGMWDVFKPLLDSIKAQEETILEKSGQTNSSIDILIDKCYSINKLIDGNQSTILKTFEDSKRSFEEASKILIKKVNLNKWILIIGFVVIAALTVLV